MKQIGFTLISAAIVCAGAGADDKAKKSQKGRKALSGTWVVVAAKGGEESLDHLKGSEWTFAGDKVTNRTSDVTEKGDYQGQPEQTAEMDYYQDQQALQVDIPRDLRGQGRHLAVVYQHDWLRRQRRQNGFQPAADQVQWQANHSLSAQTQGCGTRATEKESPGKQQGRYLIVTAREQPCRGFGWWRSRFTVLAGNSS